MPVCIPCFMYQQAYTSMVRDAFNIPRYNCCWQTYPTDFSIHISSHNKRPGSHEDSSTFLNSHDIILLAMSCSTKQFSLPLKRYQSGSQILHQAAPKPDHPPSHPIRHQSFARSPVCKHLAPGDKEWRHLTEPCCSAQKLRFSLSSQPGPCCAGRQWDYSENASPLLSCAITANCQLKNRFVYVQA